MTDFKKGQRVKIILSSYAGKYGFVTEVRKSCVMVRLDDGYLDGWSFQAVEVVKTFQIGDLVTCVGPDRKGSEGEVVRVGDPIITVLLTKGMGFAAGFEGSKVQYYSSIWKLKDESFVEEISDEIFCGRCGFTVVKSQGDNCKWC